MITSYNQVRAGQATVVTVVSDLGGTIFYHWFVDGAYVGRTAAPEKSFALDLADQARVDVVDTNDPDHDPLRNPPVGYPARRSIFFLRSTDADVDHYRVEQQKDGGAWSSLGVVHHDPAKWSYAFLTPRLVDLSTYAWRVIPVDAAGNDGTAVSLSSEKVVRTPNAPKVTATFNAGAATVTFAEAA